MCKKIGVLLSGCGFFDGSEVHETVLTLLSLDRAGVKAVCMAPNMNQVDVIDHFRNDKMLETRNVLVESARIARGHITNLELVKTNNLDGLILPGGVGSIKNLSNFALKNSEFKVHPQVDRIITQMVENRKPVGAICIAPLTVVKSLTDKMPIVTIGNDVEIAIRIEKMDGRHINCSVEEICVDESNAIVTTPAYMLGQRIKDVAIGIDKLVQKVLEFCN